MYVFIYSYIHKYIYIYVYSVRCSALQCVAMCCRVLQCDAHYLVSCSYIIYEYSKENLYLLYGYEYLYMYSNPL